MRTFWIFDRKKAALRVSGLSLVELLVVIAITGIILAIAVPRYRDYQAKTRHTVALAALAQLRKNYDIRIASGDPVNSFQAMGYDTTGSVYDMQIAGWNFTLAITSSVVFVWNDIATPLPSCASGPMHAYQMPMRGPNAGRLSVVVDVLSNC